MFGYKPLIPTEPAGRERWERGWGTHAVTLAPYQPDGRGKRRGFKELVLGEDYQVDKVP